MKRILILTCVGSMAFALAAGAADEQNNNNNAPKKKGNNNVPAVQKGEANGARSQSNVSVHRYNNANVSNQQNANVRVRNQSFEHRQHANVGDTNNQQSANVRVRNQSLEHRQHANVGDTNNQQNTNVRVRNQSFENHQHANVAITNNWNGESFSNQRYVAFHNYHRQFHDRDWWRHHCSRIVFYFGAPYYWDTGYWYPAWGYNPGFTYEYDGPIYGYNGLAPDQVLITVQTRLQQEGYYQGAVDGTMGPLTRQALADFQADHGLAVTAAVDEPTLATMGLS